MKPGLSGFVVIRNAKELDYPIKSCVHSMLPVADEIVILDSESTDGTWEDLIKFALDNPKVKLFQTKWPNPVRDPVFYVNWLNQARELVTHEWCIYLDADEIFFPQSYHEIREAVRTRKTCMCRRYNFWRDPKSCVPEGVGLGSHVIRVGPSDCFFPSDYPDTLNRDEKIKQLVRPSNIQIGHYGFLRERSAMFRKQKNNGMIWAGEIDPRIIKAETFEGNWMTMPGLCGDGAPGWENRPVPYAGPPHPDYMQAWLRERGFNC